MMKCARGKKMCYSLELYAIKNSLPSSPSFIHTSRNSNSLIKHPELQDLMETREESVSGE